jgi:hypothetical protein
MKTIYILLIITFAGFYKMQTQPVSYYIQGSANDWQLFMSSKVMADLQAGGKIVIVTLTAGDEGNGTNAFNSSAVPYYMAREMGAVNAEKFSWDILQTNPNTSAVPAIQAVTINTHPLKKYVYNNVVSYFLRLPDGNSNGNGFAATLNKSLKKFKTAAISSIAAIDGSTTYTSWADLTNTIAAIITTERGANTQVWMNTGSLDSTNATSTLNNSGDHSDHYYAAAAAQDAVSALPWVGINVFINNRSSLLAANLTATNLQNASALFTAADWTLVLNKYPSKFTAANKALLPMDYFSIKRSPVGGLPITLIDFQGILQRNNVLLSWSTTNEYNSKLFDIERSEDGVNYRKISSLPAAGISNIVKYYSYLDITATDINYYRLKMIDADGNFRFSDVILIKNNGLKQTVTSLTNPFTDNINLRFAKIPKGKISISLTDMSGRVITAANYDQLISSIFNFNDYNKSISAGVYILQVKSEGLTYNIKLVKQ